MIQFFEPMVGELFAVVLTAALMAPPALVLVYLARVLVPKYFRWWFAEAVTRRAVGYWESKCVASGMTHAGATVSMTMGLVFFVAVRAAATIPMSLPDKLSGAGLPLRLSCLGRTVHAGQCAKNGCGIPAIHSAVPHPDDSRVRFSCGDVDG